MNYTELKAGDVRQEGDEYCSEFRAPPDIACSNIRQSRPREFSEWRSVNLIGWPLLASDLILAKFRRPNAT